MWLTLEQQRFFKLFESTYTYIFHNKYCKRIFLTVFLNNSFLSPVYFIVSRQYKITKCEKYVSTDCDP